MRSIKNKFRVTRRGTTGGKKQEVILKTADQGYEEKKKSAPQTTQEQLVKFLRSHDGEPDETFRTVVRTSDERRTIYLEQLEKTLTDPGYADLFYTATGMLLCVPAGHEKDWAAQIAKALLSEPVPA